MSRQHSAPIIVDHLSGQSQSLTPIGLGSCADGFSEAQIQELVQQHPDCLPFAEIDPVFRSPVPICRELNTPAGAIDNFMLTADGLPVLVECKLWRNPEGRREVVGQIIDYAKELSRWSSADLQREVNRRLGNTDHALADLIRLAGHEVDETDFNDALSLNLRRGRFLLLIVGDGIRERVEAIAEYLQAHAGLHFTLGLVELPIYRLDDDRALVIPRILARTELIRRTVVEVPDGLSVIDSEGDEPILDDENDPVSRISFWRAFLADFTLDDPEQRIPKAGRNGYLAFMLPVRQGACWLSVYRNEASNTVGVYLSYTRDSQGQQVVERIVEDWPDIDSDLGGNAYLETDRLGRTLIVDKFATGSWVEPAERAKALAWLRSRTNDFVNVLRPRVKSLVADLSSKED